MNHTEQLEYVLSPPIEKFGKNLYAVAVFHQMHCLVRESSLSLSTPTFRPNILFYFVIERH